MIHILMWKCHSRSDTYLFCRFGSQFDILFWLPARDTMAPKKWSKERYIQHLKVAAYEKICLGCYMIRFKKYLSEILAWFQFYYMFYSWSLSIHMCHLVHSAKLQFSKERLEDSSNNLWWLLVWQDQLQAPQWSCGKRWPNMAWYGWWWVA